MSKRANGEGNIKKRTDGKWEARITLSGKRRSVYGKTQAEVMKKLKALQKDHENGIDLEAANMTVEQWLEIWMREYRNGIKDSTKATYMQDIRLHINPYIGEIKMSKLTPVIVQRLYNQAVARGLSPKSIKNTHGILHKALVQAVKIGYLDRNVCDSCELPAIRKKEMKPITDDALPRFLKAIQGDEYGDLMFVALFTGLRESEIIGLTWDCIDFERRWIRIYRQLSKERIKGGGGKYVFTDLKNKKERSFTAIPAVFDTLMRVKRRQYEWRLRSGAEWSNPNNLVFTNECGRNLATTTVWKHFKKIAQSIGVGDSRFHDLRHTFATLSIEAGNDIKTISESLGHATTAFTMDVYSHVSEKMQRDNAQRMQEHLQAIIQ